ncbi:MAG: hypothetical protein AAGC56_00035 [Pseudomonadota bacterium]
MVKVVFLQLNELNFDYVDRYIAQGKLPHFAALFERHPYVKTVSESEHHLANPWIQWPTVHTGKSYAEHGVFRLGDMVYTDHEHIYEALERRGVRVAALSPFNAKNNTKDAAFFVPDPWTRTGFVGSRSLRRLYDALVQVADDYASEKIATQALVNLSLGALDNFMWSSVPAYVKSTYGYLFGGKRWARAIVCDRLLADAFFTQCRRTKPDFATLFLNGSAHLQHHYLFSSAAYEGPRHNPEWHCGDGEDPLLEILESYDGILADLKREMPDARVMVGTGLRQNPHERETYYFRIDDHVRFLDDIDLDYADTYRLMTEDFVVHFNSVEEAAAAECRLASVNMIGGDDVFYVETADSAVRTQKKWANIFHIENRGESLYVQLRPSAVAIPKDAKVVSGEIVVSNFGERVSFAQYKNTHHQGDGSFIDTGASNLKDPMPLTDVFSHILRAFGINRSPARDIAVDTALVNVSEQRVLAETGA